MNDHPVAQARCSMTTVLLVACVSWIPSISAQSNDGRNECPVTLPTQGLTQDVPWPTEEGSDRAWYGSASLAAFVPTDGIWKGMGPERNYGDKFWWRRAGYDAHEEAQPKLSIFALRLDGPALVVEIAQATNAYGGGSSVMLVGMEFPTHGCWMLWGTYKPPQQRAQQLTVVVFVPERQAE